MLRIVSCVLLAAAAALAHADMYRWLDQEGKVHYTDTPPPTTAKNVQKKQPGGGMSEMQGVPYATQIAMKNFPVTLYVAESCGAPCTDAKALLVKRGVPFKEVAVGDEASRDELKKVSGALELPVMTVGRDVKRGYAEGMYVGALDTAGYPNSGPLAQRAAPPPKLPAKPTAPAPPVPPKGQYSP
jgi:glutaredoxin